MAHTKPRIRLKMSSIISQINVKILPGLAPRLPQFIRIQHSCLHLTIAPIRPKIEVEAPTLRVSGLTRQLNSTPPTLLSPYAEAM